MSGDTRDPRRAIEEFLEDADVTLGEYDQGYADADATLSVLEGHIDALRDVLEENVDANGDGDGDANGDGDVDRDDG
ncbi:hypothetical protein ACFQAS_04545 [Halopenitus salinus]|uniref:Uncharacterized protein n=1 Tax=Halopenitus salinus TaxID=1198295 RepID=A0ABD5V184_9EURY